MTMLRAGQQIDTCLGHHSTAVLLILHHTVVQVSTAETASTAGTAVLAVSAVHCEHIADAALRLQHPRSLVLVEYCTQREHCIWLECLLPPCSLQCSVLISASVCWVLASSFYCDCCSTRAPRRSGGLRHSESRAPVMRRNSRSTNDVGEVYFHRPSRAPVSVQQLQPAGLTICLQGCQGTVRTALQLHTEGVGLVSVGSCACALQAAAVPRARCLSRSILTRRQALAP